jgi:hypothetical protein
MINKKWFERLLLILIGFLVFQSCSIVDAIANPIIFSQDHHIGISEVYTYNEIESSVLAEDGHIDGLSRVLSVKEVRPDH